MHHLSETMWMYTHARFVAGSASDKGAISCATLDSEDVCTAISKRDRRPEGHG